MEGWVSLDLQGIHWDSAKMLTSIFLQGERKETEGAWGRIPTPHTHTCKVPGMGMAVVCYDATFPSWNHGRHC